MGHGALEPKKLASTRLSPHFYICFGFELSTLSKIKERNKIFLPVPLKKRIFLRKPKQSCLFSRKPPADSYRYPLKKGVKGQLCFGLILGF